MAFSSCVTLVSNAATDIMSLLICAVIAKVSGLSTFALIYFYFIKINHVLADGRVGVVIGAVSSAFGPL